MADVLKQTLYWNANPSSTVNDLSGSGSASQARAITAAESHDASDTTYARLQANGDLGSLEGEAENLLAAALQTASVSGAISFLRIIYRGKVSAVGGGTATGTLQPRINGTNRGSANGLGASFANYQQDFAVDPADSNPWTNAKVNAQSFGVREYTLTSDPGVYGTGGRVDMSEFKVELWGPDVQVSTPASVGAAGLACVAAVVIGAVLSSCTSVSAPVVTNDATGTAGLRVISPASVAAPCKASIDVGDEAFGRSAPWDPTAVVPLAATADGSGSPVTLRANTGNLSDQNLGTFNSDADGFGVPGTPTGTLHVSTTGVANSSIDGSGAISGVVFFAFMRGRKDADASFSNWRLCGQAVSAPNVGNTTPPYADFSLVQTGLITVDGGGLPWDWSTIYAKLAALGVGASVDYAFAGGHEFDQSVQLDVAEIWVEVHGPVGIAPEVINVTQVIDAHRRAFQLRANV